MSAPIRAVLIVIPARDEEELLPRCLRALTVAMEQLADAHPGIEIRSAVVADRTTDGTREIVTESRAADLVVVEHGNVGAARHAGVSHLLRASDDPGSVWIATTDADSVVPRDWLSEQLTLADDGTDVVVGSVVPEFDGLSTEQRAAWIVFRQRPDPSGDIHGANLGIRASAYLRVGGFRPVEVGEDVDLIARATAAGCSVVRPDGLVVGTSSRTDARAPAGYASWLHGGGLIMAIRDSAAGRSEIA